MPEASSQAWIEPGAHEVVPGVWRIPLPLPNDGLRAVNVYAVRDGDGVVLIDGGWALAAGRGQLIDSLASTGHELTDIHEFLVTHVHRDHYTQAVAIRRDYGTPVALGQHERAALDLLGEMIREGRGPDHAELDRYGAGDLAKTLRGLAPGAVDLENWEYPDRWLSDGEDVVLAGAKLRAIETPGHTRGHVVFHDEAAGLLFAGDHVLPHITPSIGVEMPPTSSPLADFMASLAKIRALPDARILPAHGPVSPSSHARVEELLAHHEQRLTESAQAVAHGASTVFEVAGVLRWTRRGRALTELDIYNTMLAVNETAAHLTVLVARGWLAVTEVDGVLRYTTA